MRKRKYSVKEIKTIMKEELDGLRQFLVAHDEIHVQVETIESFRALRRRVPEEINMDEIDRQYESLIQKYSDALAELDL